VLVVELVRAFQKRSLADRDYLDVRVDGVHFNVRLEEDRLCTRVMRERGSRLRDEPEPRYTPLRNGPWALICECRAR